ncbi:hypothetical protein D9756_011055 [Leucocoprinus leucothites]|uniref:Uncharacterized protein n=1 Tax=Leucocoprinus leucothites TaxID=201217 RepID=A0A8H5FQM7_9AGAR|nr:hypothetical protein D9756_011055 [Leucoagaricus leucothites]
MSTLDFCLPSNLDTSGIGDGKVTLVELEALETQSTTILITVFAILLLVIIQALQCGLMNYHAAIILDLSWMNNTNLFIYFFLYVYHTFKLKDEAMKQGEDQRTLRAFWTSQMKNAAKNPVLIIGSLHLSLMSAVGIWLWAKPLAFGNSPPCSPSASLFIVGQQTSIGSQDLRKWSLLIYSLLLIPGLNLIAPIGFFTAPIWVLHHFFSFPLKQESMLRFARVGLAMLVTIDVILLADTEITIGKNQGLTANGDSDWTFGQTLALLLLLIPMHDIGEVLSERCAKIVGERLKAASTTGIVEMVYEAIKSGASRGAIESSIMAAFKEGHVGIVEVLIKKTAGGEAIYSSLWDALTAYYLPEWSALHHAATYGHSHGRTALHLAALNGQTETAKVLAELRVKLDTEDSDRWTALLYAAEYGYTEIVKALAELGAKLNTKDSRGWTALHHAAINGYTERVKVLAELGAELDTKDLHRQTALDLAILYNYTEIVKVLTKLRQMSIS